MKLSSPTLPGVYPSIAEIIMAAEFWYNAKRVRFYSSGALPSFVVHPMLPERERGQFHRCGKDIQVWAFLQKMKDLIDRGDTEELEFLMSAVLKVNFDVVHFSGNVLDGFWTNLQQTEEAKLCYEFWAMTQHFSVWRSLSIYRQCCVLRESHTKQTI